MINQPIKKVHGRHGSRWVALQALYAWQIAKAPLAQIEGDAFTGELWDDPAIEKKISFDKNYFHELVFAIGENCDDLDALILPHIDRPIHEIHAIEHAILWIAIYELKTRIETPYRVILNEAIILAKEFGAQDSHKFINGVLDKAAKVLRERELAIC